MGLNRLQKVKCDGRGDLDLKCIVKWYFRLSPLLKQVRKVVGGFGKKVVLVLV